MSLAFVQTQPKGKAQPPPNSNTIQKMLDENIHLIQVIVDYQNKGRASECAQYQVMLHRNLVYLATVADSNLNVQAVLPAPVQVNPNQSMSGGQNPGPPQTNNAPMNQMPRTANMPPNQMNAPPGGVPMPPGGGQMPMTSSGSQTGYNGPQQSMSSYPRPQINQQINQMPQGKGRAAPGMSTPNAMNNQPGYGPPMSQQQPQGPPPQGPPAPQGYPVQQPPMMSQPSQAPPGMSQGQQMPPQQSMMQQSQASSANMMGGPSGGPPPSSQPMGSRAMPPPNAYRRSPSQGQQYSQQQSYNQQQYGSQPPYTQSQGQGQGQQSYSQQPGYSQAPGPGPGPNMPPQTQYSNYPTGGQSQNRYNPYNRPAPTGPPGMPPSGPPPGGMGPGGPPGATHGTTGTALLCYPPRDL
ncbi:SS18 [Acanthosepion pharaonis]|uniref:SS18 n=1 Tax=Acanthosepion pharaonis TaxID=158019 RepID=A0A812CPN1_ACAPH|nr:SS18 [Sepia pharaonis]